MLYVLFNNGFYLFFLLFAVFTKVHANDFNENIHLGKIEWGGEYALSHKTVDISNVCGDGCDFFLSDSLTTSLKRDGSILNQTNIDGLLLEIKYNINNKKHIDISLIRAKDDIEFKKDVKTTFNLTTFWRNEGVLKREVLYYNVFGEISLPNCSVVDNNLKISMPSISKQDLLMLDVGEVKYDVYKSSYLEIDCRGFKGLPISLGFTSSQVDQSKKTLVSNNKSVGFVVINEIDDVVIDWSGGDIYKYTTDEDGKLTFPFTVYYTKINSGVSLGEVNSVGSFIVKYD